MSLTKYLRIIEGINPGKIQIENVRSLLNTSRFNAKLICELGVEEGIFEKRIGLVCPNDGMIIKDFGEGEPLPDTICCGICEDEEQEEFNFDTSKIRKIEFYQLSK